MNIERYPWLLTGVHFRLFREPAATVHAIPFIASTDLGFCLHAASRSPSHLVSKAADTYPHASIQVKSLETKARALNHCLDYPYSEDATTSSSTMSPTELHPGTKGFADAASYDAYRPSYPPEAMQKFLSHLRIADVPHARVLDLAAGTGKLTEVLAARHEGLDIVAVEPHREMRAELERKALKDTKVLDGFAAKVPLEEEWGDACVVGQVSNSRCSWEGLFAGAET